ncbi:MAG: 1-deoxy-D-xylulose-5-phosphate synthase [Campylobacterales bacterium]
MINLNGKSIAELEEIAAAIRQKILQTVSRNGGHLSSSLGAVDLIVAMHTVFDVTRDPFIYDVSHQAYAHKLLTDRWERFDTLRQFGGISGYIKPKESPFDYFGAGHSSTSISVAVGAAKAIALKEEQRIPVVLIGDGSMTAGMVYEALNELGERKYPVVIIINDNEMSISKPIGAISQYLSKLMAGRSYQGIKGWVRKALQTMPPDMKFLAKRFDESLKLITPGILFEELGLEYIGPVDGHNLSDLVEVLTLAKNLGKPVVVHAQTIKGKGYTIAEGGHEHWHGVGPFDLATGKPLTTSSSAKSATAIFGEELIRLAKEDHRIVGLTAAMPSGTGMKGAIEAMGDRFWDVAIAEQHAVTSAAALAKEGLRPVCALYSTFLQRGYDQVIHDVCLQGLPVIFAIDRAGIVGEDGETHQGAFDLSYLRPIPNIVLFAPRDEETMRQALRFAIDCPKPCAFRYPRGAFYPHEQVPSSGFELGRLQMMAEGDDLLLVGYGNGVGRAMAVRQELAAAGVSAAVVDLRFLKPLDETALLELANRYQRWYVMSDSAKAGGVGSALLELLAEKDQMVRLKSFEYGDYFITHGKTEVVEESLGLLPSQIAASILTDLKPNK